MLVRDSNHSDWLYVVKSGSVCVLMRLNAAAIHAKKKQTPATDGARRPSALNRWVELEESAIGRCAKPGSIGLSLGNHRRPVVGLPRHFCSAFID